MKRISLKLWDVPNAAFFSALAITAALFLCGAVAGCITAAYISESSGSALADYLSGYLTYIKSGRSVAVSFGDALFNSYKYHAVCFFLGFTALGVLFTPIVVAARGFFLSFTVTAFVKLLGYKGLTFAAGILAPISLFTLPCLFIIASQSFSASAALLSVTLRRDRKNSIYGRSYFTKAVFCAAVLFVCALFETFISPLITQAIASYIITTV